MVALLPRLLPREAVALSGGSSALALPEARDRPVTPAAASAHGYPRSMAEVSTAAVAPARGQGPRPWTQAWIDALPLAPAWVGCAFAAGHVLLGALYFAVFVAPRISAAWPAYQDHGVLFDTSVFALIIGYATAALAYARRGHETTLRPGARSPGGATGGATRRFPAEPPRTATDANGLQERASLLVA